MISIEELCLEEYWIKNMTSLFCFVLFCPVLFFFRMLCLIVMCSQSFKPSKNKLEARKTALVDDLLEIEPHCKNLLMIF